MPDFIVKGPKVKVLPKSLQEVGVAISSAKIRALCPRAEIDGIAVDLVDGISYAQLARLSASLGTAEIYVDLVPGDSGSAGRDHLVLTINWDSPGGMDNEVTVAADETVSQEIEQAYVAGATLMQSSVAVNVDERLAAGEDNQARELEQRAEDYVVEKLGGAAPRAARAVVRDAFLAGHLVGALKFLGTHPLYEVCSRAFGTPRDDAKARLVAAIHGMDKKKADERKSKPPEALSKGLQQPVLYSPRGIPLVWGSGHPKAGAVLTVECYCKWYELFLVCPDAIVGVDFGVLGMHSKDEAPYCDHAPNPRAVYRYAQARGYLLDNVAFEMIIGRWEIEYHEHYDVEQEDDCLGRRLGGP